MSIVFSSENKLGSCPGVMAGDPAVTKKGLVVIQEWWGMNSYIIEKATSLSKSGFVTLTPDLYRGKVAINWEEAGHLSSQLDWAGAVEDVKGAIAYLRSVGCTKVGVTGFCMGGALSLATAALSSVVDAAVPFYGVPRTDLCDVKKIKCPVQCHFGDKDDIAGVSAPPDAQKLEDALKETGILLEFYRYDAGHAFTNPTSPNFDKDCCTLALGRMCDFMNKHLS